MSNVRIITEEITRLPSFNELKREIPLTDKARETILRGRREVEAILRGEDRRKIVVVGPCSIHNIEEALQYARQLAPIVKKVEKTALIIMRVCFDKPRTRKNWDGLFPDPRLDGSCDVAFGFRLARKLMVAIAELGVVIGSEALDDINFHVISDLVSYTWIGARTVSAPKIRKMGSGLSVPVGTKNPNNGPIDLAIDAIEFMSHPNVFTGPDDDGILSRIPTRGNILPHLILRGDSNGPNHTNAHVRDASERLVRAGLCSKIIVDCSHGNSLGKHEKQIEVARSVIDQVLNGETAIVGIMLESYLEGGKQDGSKLGTPEGPASIGPRKSVTDACLSWQQTEGLLLELNEKLGS